MKLIWLPRLLRIYFLLFATLSLSAQGFERQVFFPAPITSNHVADYLLPDHSLLLGNGNSLLLVDRDGRESWNVQLAEDREIIGLGGSITGDTLYVVSLEIDVNDVVTATLDSYDSEGNPLGSQVSEIKDFQYPQRSRNYHNRAFVSADGSVEYVIGAITVPVGGGGFPFNATNRLLVITVDPEGEVVQEYALTTGEYFTVHELDILADRSLAAKLLVDTTFDGTVELDLDPAVSLFHGYPDGTLVQLLPYQRTNEEFSGMSRVSDHEIAFGLRPSDNSEVESWIFDVATDSLLHRLTIPVSNQKAGLYEEIAAYGESDYLLLLNGLWIDGPSHAHPWIIRTDSAGNLLEEFVSPVAVGSYFTTELFQPLPDGGVYTLGYLTTPSNNDTTGNTYRLLRLDAELKTFTNLLEGRLLPALAENDCQPDSLRTGLPRWWIVAESLENTGETLYGYTAADGSFSMRVDSGSYRVRTVVPNDYYGSCPPRVFHFGAADDTVSVSLSGQILEDCSLPVITLGATVLSDCEEGYYVVNYFNEGTVAEPDPLVRVVLDSLFLPASSSPPWTQQLGDTLLYELPPLEVNESGNIYIYGMIDCDNPLPGVTHCTEARIFPDTFCTPVNPLWDGSSIEVVGSCDGDTARFTIINVGADMMAPLDYVITEDFVIHLGGDFQLPSQASFDINVRVNNGATYRLAADQAAFHPGSSMPSTTVEGCGTFDLEEFSLGLTALFAQDQGDPFVSIHCFPNLVAGDPDGLAGDGSQFFGFQSSKVPAPLAKRTPLRTTTENLSDRPLVYLRANPGGIGAEHLIDTATTVHYQLAFRKPTALEELYAVSLRGQLPAGFDLSSLRPGAASHPYAFNVSPKGAIEFELRSPDGQGLTIPPAYDGWGGFIQFSVRLARNVAPGTVLDFQPEIVMNHRAPLLTNPVSLKVRKPQRYAFVNTFDCQPELDTVLETRRLDSFSFANYDSLLLTIMTEASSYQQTEYREAATGDTIAGVVITDDLVFSDTLITQAGCDSIITYFITIVGVNDPTAASADVILFPNPAGDYFGLRFTDGMTADRSANLRLTDTGGRVYVLDHDNSQIIGPEATLIFQTHQLPPGLYLLSGGYFPDRWTKKLIIKR